MNVSLRRILLIVLSVLAFGPLRLPGQSLKKDTLEVFRDVRGEYYFEAISSPGGIIQKAKHGQVWIDAILPGNSSNKIYKLIYEPNPGFIGLDTFRYNRMTCFQTKCYEEWEVLVRVKSSEVKAEPDLFYVPVNAQPTTLDILKNDFSSSGKMSIVNVSAINNGVVFYSEDKKSIQFQPKANFTGVAQLIYTVCDVLGSCDQASAGIVVGKVQGNGQDTLRIFTLRDEPVEVLVPNIFTLVESPEKGTFAVNESIPVYQPTPGFTGKDYLSFDGPESDLVVEINVLNVRRNRFAVDDRADVTPGRHVEIDVLANDGFGANAGCFSFGQPKYGRVSYESGVKGVLTYKAPEGFVGIDEFTYASSQPGCGGTEETATVYVFVSNYEPAYTKFRMNTPKNTPLVITYNVPIQEFNFRVSQKAKQGSVTFLEGLVDTVIYGQRVFGFNVLLYTPDLNATGTDEFEVTYCLSGNTTNGCRLRKNVKVEVDIIDLSNDDPLCIDDCIWAGDTNLDGLVNMEDLLPVGRFMGEVGLPRANPNLDVWFGQFGKDWQNPFAINNVDLKHIDTDGDSLITALDTVAIRKFYGRTHSLVPMQLPFYDFEIRLEGDVFAEPGQEVVLDMVMGDAQHPVVDLYGFTFNLSYNPYFFQPDKSRIEFYDNSWLTYNSPVLYMTRNQQDGLLEAGFTRTNGKAVSGMGKVGRSKVVVTEDIIGVGPPDEEGNYHVELGGGYAVGMNGAGQSFAIRVAPFTLTIRDKQQQPPQPGKLGDLNRREQRATLGLFPNPAQDMTRLLSPAGQTFQRVQVYALTGQLVFDSGEVDTQNMDISVKSWANGIYLAKVLTNDGVVTQKFEVVK